VPVVDLRPLEELVQSTGRLVAAIEPMPGGASTRRYFRVRLDGGQSAVAMFVPGGDRPEERVNPAPGSSSGAVRRWSFLEVRELLERRGVRVPRLFAESTKVGWLLLEDLGDETLAARIEAAPSQREKLYARAVTDLCRAQEALSRLPEGSIVATRSFDQELLRWELEHFREWALDARGHSLTSEEGAALDGVFGRLAERIASLPRAFVHRDYQSRNLMVVDEELVWIDFQDALLGPLAYDLVALLHDSYQDLDDVFVNARLRDFATAAGMSSEQFVELRLQFDWVAVQRKLKDAGRFVFLERVKHNPGFLPYVAPTLRKVARTLDRLAPLEPDMATLRAILQRALPDEVGS
jgi:aminoglycoside/choline kinase family phosphotransferase